MYMGLYNVISFEAVSEEEYPIEYDIHTISEFTAELCQEHRKYGKVPPVYPKDRGTQPVTEFVFYPLRLENVILYLTFTQDQLQKEKIIDLFDHRIYKEHFLRFTFNHETKFIHKSNLRMLNIYIKPGYNTDYYLREDPDPFTQAIIHGSFEVYSLRSRPYAALLQDRAANIKAYYKQVDRNTLKGSLKELDYIEKSYTEEQKEIILGSDNVVFFGRSGTGKTQCCIHSLFSRDLVARAIDKKLKLKFTGKESKPAKPASPVLKSIFITASPFLAKDVKAQFDRIKEKVSLGSQGVTRETDEESIMNSLNPNARTNELPATFDDEAIDYPLFLSFQEFITIYYRTMVTKDFSLQRNQKEVKLESQNEDTIIEAKISEIVSSFGDKAKELASKRSVKQSKSGAKKVKTSGLRRQVDFKMFFHEFYCKKIMRDHRFRSLSSSVIWSEIRMKIKGSSFQFYKMLEGKSFDSENYQHVQKVKAMYTMNSPNANSELLALVFEVFVLYERWKASQNLYDIEDLVGCFYDSNINWLNPVINFDLLIIDEVQDLSFNSIQIMVNLCLNKVIICGDNAQNIDKGINFKFNDLKNFLVESCLSKRSEALINYTDYEHMAQYSMSLQDYYLDMNFRNSHKILRLANLPLCILEAFFKTEIDTYPKEEGYFDGPIPKVFELGLPVESLTQYLRESLKMAADEICSIETGSCETNLKIGNDFCIIVRDQQAKSSVPSCFKQCVVMTLQESKGLEFEHVLLYNFFTKNENETAWRFMTTNLQIEEIAMPKELTKEEFETKNFYQRSKLQVQLLLNREKGTAIKVDSLISGNSINSQGKLDGLSADLKFLYVAITRAKKNFIIFDEAKETESINHYRLKLDKIMESRELVKIIKKSNLSSFVDEYTPSQVSLATLKQVAREKGYSLLRQGSYEAAMRLFKISGDSKLISYCSAAEKARVASELLSLEFDEELKKKYKNLSAFRDEIFTSLKSAALIYSQLGKYFEAGKAYFSSEEYAEAAKNFELAGFPIYQAHSSFMSKNYEQALKIYKRQGVEDMINICIMSMAELGIDISKLELEEDDDEPAIDPSKLNEATYSVYLKDLISGFNREIKGLNEFDLEEPMMSKLPSISQGSGLVMEEKSESFEMVKSVKDEDSWCKVNSMNQDDASEFQDIKSQVLQLSKDGSFKELAESMSLHEDSNGVLDKMLHRFEKQAARILQMILEVPGIEHFGISKETSLVELLMVMSVLYRFEDVGIKLFKESQSTNTVFINALAVNKMLRLDVNTLKNRMFKLPLPERRAIQVAPESIERELISLNVFDIISAFQQGPAANLSLDEIIRQSFFDIVTTGLSQHFLSFSNDPTVKQALSFFISWTDYMKLYEKKDGDEGVHPESKEPLLLQTKLVPKSNCSVLIEELAAFFEKKETETTFKPSMVDEASADYFLERFVGMIVECRGKDKLPSLGIRLAGNCIKMLRLLLKRDYLLPPSARPTVLQRLQTRLQFKDLSDLQALLPAYADFALLHKESVTFEILNRAAKGPVSNKQLAFYAADETESLFLVQRNKLLNALLLSLLYVVGEAVGVEFESLVDVARFEMVAGVTKQEKVASGFVKVKVSKASADVFMEKAQIERGYEKAFEEQLYVFSMKVAAEKGYTEHYLTCYRYYRSLHDRIDEMNSSYVAGIIKSKMVANTKARLFHLAKEAEDALICGDVNEALAKMVDLEDYCNSQNIRLGNANIAFVGLLKVLILLIANCKFGDPDSFGKYMNYKEKLYLPRFWAKELARMHWVVVQDGQYYFDEAAINGDLVDEATFKLADKLYDNVDLVSKDVLEFYPDLKLYLDNLFAVHNDPQEIVKSCICLTKFSELSNEKRIELKELKQVQENKKTEKTAYYKKQETKSALLELKEMLKLSKILRYKPRTSEQIKLQLTQKAQNIPQQSRSMEEKQLELLSLRTTLIESLFKATCETVITYHFKSDLLRLIERSLLAKDPEHLNRLVREIQSKSGAFEEQRKRAGEKSTEAARYSRELRDRLRMVALTGGQIYRKICTRLQGKMSFSK